MYPNNYITKAIKALLVLFQNEKRANNFIQR